jgi:hypothetical protein
VLKKRFVVTGAILSAVMGVAIYCHKDNPVAPPASTGLLGVWSGSAGRQGGGGVGNLDSFGVVITIKQTGYSLVRGNKVWGSSLYDRDSSRDAGSWTTAGDSIMFTPDTVHDSCFKNPGIANPDGWGQCLGDNEGPEYCSCFGSFALKIDTSGALWHNAVIVNPKLAPKADTFTLVKR